MSYKQNKIQKIIENKERQRKIAQSNRKEDNAQSINNKNNQNNQNTKNNIEKKQSPKKTKSTSKHLKKYNDKEIDENIMSAYTEKVENSINIDDNFM